MKLKAAPMKLKSAPTVRKVGPLLRKVAPLLLLCALTAQGCRPRQAGEGERANGPECQSMEATAAPGVTAAPGAIASPGATAAPATAPEAELPAGGDGAVPGEEVTADALRAKGEDAFFRADTISDAVFARMDGVSWKPGCPVAREDLRYLRVLHKDAAGRTLVGEMVCAAGVAQDLLEIFRTLYDASYPIERMLLVDDYGADDNASMRANNSSCFNFRPRAGQRALSRHAYGTAVDINPLYNPFVKVRPDGSVRVEPEEGRAYADRTVDSPYRIDRGDLCQTVFRAHGFWWGGTWRSSRDYQHFER